jgi:hypothetical protein
MPGKVINSAHMDDLEHEICLSNRLFAKNSLRFFAGLCEAALLKKETRPFFWTRFL